MSAQRRLETLASHLQVTSSKPMAKRRCPITSHILDTTLGRPARGVSIVLEELRGAGLWTEMGRGVTNDDGRVEDLLSTEHALLPGRYRLTFDTEGYFNSIGSKTFYPEVTIVFEIEKTDQHYHVPLLLNPYGYSTYRGS